MEIRYGEQTCQNSIELADGLEVATINGDLRIENAFANKNNSLHIIGNITTGGAIGVRAGNNYPNKILGDAWFGVGGGYCDIIIEDISRFENRDGSITITFSEEVQGEIIVVAKRAGLDPRFKNIYNDGNRYPQQGGGDQGDDDGGDQGEDENGG